MPEVIIENGGTPVRTRVGHSLIKKVMAETGAAFGGEHSGHYYFRDNFRADSGIIAALVVLEAAVEGRRAALGVRKPFERYADSGEINTQVGDPLAVIDARRRRLPPSAEPRTASTASPSTSVDWWFNLRPSNTEPLLRLNLEAAAPAEVDEHVAEVRALIAEHA